jgi:hypothetical protein
MTHLRRFSIVALAAVLLVVPGAATSQSPTLDQSQSRFVTWLGVGGPEAMMAQTFTAGLSGGLPRVDLAVNTGEAQPNSPLAVEQARVAESPAARYSPRRPFRPSPAALHCLGVVSAPACRVDHGRHVVRAHATSP